MFVSPAVDADEPLYRRAQRGDAEAFDRLYARYERRLFGFLLRLTGDRAEAEELFHDALLKVLEPHAVRLNEGGFAPWLFRIARNLFANRYRKHARGADALALLTDAPAAASPEELIVESERATVLARAVSTLPATLASVFHLRTSGLSYEEIAGVLEIPVGTVKSRINSMVQQLRGAMP